MTSAGFLEGFRYEIVNAIILTAVAVPLATEEAIILKVFLLALFWG